jgi:hypothetical protein
MGTLSNFAAHHWVVGGIATSVLWFVAGKQSLSNRRADAAIFWQSVAVLIILIVIGWAAAKKEWLGMAVATAVLYVEVRAIRRSLRASQ